MYGSRSVVTINTTTYVIILEFSSDRLNFFPQLCEYCYTDYNYMYVYCYISFKNNEPLPLTVFNFQDQRVVWSQPYSVLFIMGNFPEHLWQKLITFSNRSKCNIFLPQKSSTKSLAKVTRKFLPKKMRLKLYSTNVKSTNVYDVEHIHTYRTTW